MLKQAGAHPMLKQQLHFDFLCLFWVKTQLSMDVSYKQDFSYFYT